VQQEAINSSYSKLDLGSLSGTISLLTELLIDGILYPVLDPVILSLHHQYISFKKRLDEFWAETRYGHTQRPAAYNL